MTDSYLKAVTALAAVLFTVGFAGGQPAGPGDQAPDNVGPKDGEKTPSEANKSNGRMKALDNLPDLPSQAADEAVTAVSSVGDFLSGSITDLGSTLGDLLGGGNDTRSEPENGPGTEGTSL